MRRRDAPVVDGVLGPM